MHIIIIGWLFTAAMLSIGAQSVIAGILTFFFWGILPVILISYIFERRKNRQK